MTDDAQQPRQRGVRRSAIILGVIAFAVYAGFILVGVIHSPGAV